MDKKYKLKYPWKIVFWSIKNRCNNKNASNFKYYGGRGIKSKISEEEIKELWFRDKAYLLNKPSIDREDNDGDYTFDNCKFIELSINSNKNRKRIIFQYDLKGNFIKEWESLTLAGELLKLNIGNINSTLCNRPGHKTCGGFIWKYKYLNQ